MSTLGAAPCGMPGVKLVEEGIPTEGYMICQSEPRQGEEGSAGREERPDMVVRV